MAVRLLSEVGQSVGGDRRGTSSERGAGTQSYVVGRLSNFLRADDLGNKLALPVVGVKGGDVSFAFI